LVSEEHRENPLVAALHDSEGKVAESSQSLEVLMGFVHVVHVEEHSLYVFFGREHFEKSLVLQSDLVLDVEEVEDLLKGFRLLKKILYILL
jgi:hypothetical protein